MRRVKPRDEQAAPAPSPRQAKLSIGAAPGRAEVGARRARSALVQSMPVAHQRHGGAVAASAAAALAGAASPLAAGIADDIVGRRGGVLGDRAVVALAGHQAERGDERQEREEGFSSRFNSHRGGRVHPPSRIDKIAPRAFPCAAVTIGGAKSGDGAMATRARTPVHLWIVGVLALLWNGIGGYDYLMTRMRNIDYRARMMPHGRSRRDVGLGRCLPDLGAVRLGPRRVGRAARRRAAADAQPLGRAGVRARRCSARCSALATRSSPRRRSPGQRGR